VFDAKCNCENYLEPTLHAKPLHVPAALIIRSVRAQVLLARKNVLYRMRWSAKAGGGGVGSVAGEGESDKREAEVAAEVAAEE
jgi:hypothetical protein